MQYEYNLKPGPGVSGGRRSLGRSGDGFPIVSRLKRQTMEGEFEVIGLLPEGG